MDTYILGLESSCDETSAAVIKNGKEVLSNIISSQIEVHKKFGGVVPEVASRKHLENILVVVDEALAKAGIKKEQLTGIGVTNRPGLIGALLVGITGAKALSYSLGIPLIPVHHLRGHIYANTLEHSLDHFPYLCLIISGGHTSLAIWHNHESIEVIGQTLDDAAGEVFDKVARALGLEYPGGPVIEMIALEGNSEVISFPVAQLGKESFDFSFSGLKSSVLNYLNQQVMKGLKINKAEVAASFQRAVFKALEEKIFLGVRQYGIKTVVLAGGVVANKTMIAYLERRGQKEGVSFVYPSSILCTDNGVMIGAAAYYLNKLGVQADYTLNAFPTAIIE